MNCSDPAAPDAPPACEATFAQRYQVLYATSPLAFVLWDLDGRITEWNIRAEALFGWKAHEVIGKELHHLLLPAEEVNRFRAAVQGLTHGEGDGSFSGRSIGKDGTARHCDWRNVALRNLHGKLTGVMSLVLDATSERQARDKLEKSEKLYRTLVETSPDAILLLAPDGRITTANQQAYRLFDLNELEDISRVRFAELLPPDERHPGLPDFLGNFDDCTGFIVNRQERMRRRSGAGFDAELAYTTIVDAAGTPTGIVLFARDITDKKRAAEELEQHQLHLQELVHERTGELEAARDRLAKIIDGSPVPTFVLDAEHVVTHWNKACERTMGKTAAEMVGTRKQWEVFYADKRPVLADLVLDGAQEAIERLYGGQYRHSQVVGDGFEGEAYFPAFDRWLFFTAAPLRDQAGRIVGAIETLQDVNERKQAEQALIEAKGVAESAARAKAAFLANMSHEIRTPMNAVIGLAHLLLRTGLSGKQRDYVTRIQGAGQLLLGLINDVLDFSKIEAGRMQLESAAFVLDDVLDNLATVVLDRAQEKGLELQYVVDAGVPSRLVGDPLRLAQILINLVGNAIKFTARGSVTIYFRAGPPQDGRTRLDVEVQDTGIGMSEEQQQHLFRAFSQADSSITRKYGGSGLGLTISKRLVEMMGGDIRVSSRVGRGSTFAFSAWLGVGESEAAPVLPSHRVLVVDDNPLARTVLVRLIEKQGSRAVAAESGDEALAILQDPNAGRFDCVTIDLNMPGMDGLELAHAIRLMPGTSPRLVMVTATDTNSLDRPAGLGEIDAVLHKPVTAAQIGKLLAGLTPSAAAPAQPVRDAAAPLAGLRLLVTEDNATNRLIATETLSALGATVETAEHGGEALRKMMAKERGYDIVLMDIQMPEMDGLEATRRIRADGRWPDLPIIAMTAHALDEERRRCRQAGMNDFVTKPIDPEFLLSTLQRWRPGAAPAAPSPAAQPVSPPHQEAPAQAAPFEADGLPSLPGIDKADGLRRMMNKPRLYERVLRDFHQRFRDEAAQIQSALAAGDIETAQRRAHTAKGLAGSIGARDLQTAALDLESAIRNGGTDVARQLAAFAAALRLVIDSIAAGYGL